MTTLSRKDGEQFVLHAYRELIDVSKRSQALKQIRSLAQSYGQFVHIAPVSNQQIEVSFSDQPGYLLGDSVRCYFSQYPNLICIDFIEGSTQALLVVIYDNDVMLDARVDVSKLEIELASVLADPHRYHLCVFGSEANQMMVQTIFATAQDKLLTNDALKTSVLSMLPLNAATTLKPLALALKSEALQMPQIKILMGAITLVVAVLIASFIWHAWFHASNKPVRPIAFIMKQPKVTGIQIYKKAMQAPSVASIITSVTQFTRQIAQAPGWHLTAITIKGNELIARIDHDTGGQMQPLQRWADRHNIKLDLTQSGVVLSKVVQLQPRTGVHTIYAIKPTEEEMIDVVDQFLNQRALSIGHSAMHGKLMTKDITLQVNGFSADRLNQLMHALKKMPIVLDKVNLSANGFLLNGNINMTLWGMPS